MSPSRPAAYSRSLAAASPSPSRSFLPPPPTLAPQTFWMLTVGRLMLVSSAGSSTFLFFLSFDLQAVNTAADSNKPVNSGRAMGCGISSVLPSGFFG